MIVRIVRGVSPATCGCGSWLWHWENFSRRRPPRFCAERDCLQWPTVGSLVQKETELDEQLYVVPLCDAHSALEGQSIEIGQHTVLVPAVGTVTCGKR